MRMQAQGIWRIWCTPGAARRVNAEVTRMIADRSKGVNHLGTHRLHPPSSDDDDNACQCGTQPSTNGDNGASCDRAPPLTNGVNGARHGGAPPSTNGDNAATR